MRKKSLLVFPMALLISLFIFSCNKSNDEAMEEEFEQERMELKQSLEDARERIDKSIDDAEKELSDLKAQMDSNMENANDELKTQWNNTENEIEDRDFHRYVPDLKHDTHSPILHV